MKKLCFSLLLINLIISNNIYSADNQNKDQYEKEREEKGEAEKNSTTPAKKCIVNFGDVNASQSVEIDTEAEVDINLQRDAQQKNCCQKAIGCLVRQSKIAAKSTTYRVYSTCNKLIAISIGAAIGVKYLGLSKVSAGVIGTIIGGDVIVSYFNYHTFEIIWDNVIIQKGYKKLMCCKKKPNDDNEPDKKDPNQGNPEQDPSNNV